MSTWKRKDNGNVEVVPDRLDNMMKRNPVYERDTKKKASTSTTEAPTTEAPTTKENDK